MPERVYIFDTTLRDGEQSPGASMGLEEKLQIAAQLERLGVDVIEAGFPIASEGESDAVRQIARSIKKVTVTGLTRTRKADIDRTWKAISVARRPRLHIFIATSDIHLKYKLKMTREQVLKEAVEAVRHGKGYTPDVEFSAEDATRSDREFLARVVAAVIDAGASVVNIPDTVGYAIPIGMRDLILYLRSHVSNIDQVVLSCHCHNDLGLAVANSLAAVNAGARQVECTINGIGERAGNASLEELVMTWKTRNDILPFVTNVNTSEIYRSSRLLSSLTGLTVARNKPVVGKNAFAHEAGIHQHGVIQKAITYEIMTPDDIGRDSSELVMGKHSGRHGLRKRCKELGYSLTRDKLERVYLRFMELADKKREVFDEDLMAVLDDELSRQRKVFELDYLQTIGGTSSLPTATVRLKQKGKVLIDSATGDGPVDATYKAIDRITGKQGKLLEYSINAVSKGKDAVGEAQVKVDFGDAPVIGRASSTDIIEASARAYLSALNKALLSKKKPSPKRKRNK